MSPIEAVILAGGLGTRLRSVVSDVPKPMAPIGRRPFLEYLLDFWINEGVRRFVLAVGYKHESVVEHFGFSYHGIPIDYSIEKEPLGTGGGLFLAFEKILSDHSFFIINGDTFFPVNASYALMFHQKKKSKFTMALKEMVTNERYGTIRLTDDDRINRFCSPGEGDPPYLINGGVYLANPEGGLARGRTKSAEGAFLEGERPAWGHDGRNRRGQLVSGGRGRERKAFRSGPMDQGSQGERSSGAFPSLAQAVR